MGHGCSGKGSNSVIIFKYDARAVACAVFSQNSPGCETSIYTSLLHASSLLSTIMNEVWHHLAQEIKTITQFLSIVLPPKKNCKSNPLTTKLSSLSLGIYLAVIHQQSLTKIYKHTEYLAIDSSTRVQTTLFQDCFGVDCLVSSQRPDGIFPGWLNI